MGSTGKRREIDVMKLMMSDYDVSLVNDSMNDFHVIFDGPKDSAYEGGRWKVHVELPEGYPYKSPSIGFCNRMYHPNVDEMCGAPASAPLSPWHLIIACPAPLCTFRSGSVCLDVINQTWSPMFDLLNIFDTFLPQLLLYPNPADPLNSEAAALLLGHPEEYRKKVKDYIARYAQGAGLSTDDESERQRTSGDEPEEDDDMSYISDGSDSL